MTPTPAWRRYLTFWRERIADDVDDELRFHAEMRVQDHMARGMSETDARRAVAARLGDLEAAKTECVELGHVRRTHARNADVLEGIRADVRYALRSLRRTPGWTAVALLTIALGVGATTTVFSVADTLLVRPFPHPGASRVFLARRQFTIDRATVPVPPPFGTSVVWRREARSIEAAALVGSAGFGTLSIGPDTFTVHAAVIEPEFLSFAGTHVIAGRSARPEELSDSGPGAMLLTEQFWRRAYGGSPDGIGKTVRYRTNTYTILGVVPASLTFPDFRAERADVLLEVSPTIQGGSSTGGVLVRLKPGVSRDAARQELEAIMKHANLPDVRPVPMEMPLRLSKPQDWLAIRQPLVMLVIAVGLLLLVACTNIAHLLLARGAARQRELAVRHALGAGQRRLLRQLVTESTVLATGGGALALLVAWGGLRILGAMRPATYVALSYVSINRSTAVIAAALAIAVGLAIGLLAALRTAHRDLGLTLHSGAMASPRGGRRLRSGLVVAEVALSTTLLVVALLLVHAVVGLQRMSLGFDADGIYAISVPVPKGSSPTAFAQTLRERAAILPGVAGVTVAQSAPATRGFMMIAAFETPDRARAPEDAQGGVAVNAVQPDYFSTLRIPLIAGRTFDEGSGERNEVVVSSSVAREIAPNGDAIGTRIRNAVSKSRGVVEPWQTVVGVVPDLVTKLSDGTGQAGLYSPLGTRGNEISLIVRLSGSAAPRQLERFAKTLGDNPSRVVVTNVREAIAASVAEPQFTMRVLAIFAGVGVALAAIGLFGVISYGVGQRTREIGVRMTLGATRPAIARLVVGDGVRLTLLGTSIGLLGARAGAGLVQTQLYGVSRADPIAFGGGAVLLLLVAIAACAAPMLRATSIDPSIAMRAD